MPDAPPGPGPGTGFVSNTPSATVVDVGASATPNLVLLSSNLLQEPSAGEFFQQWIGEVKNTGSTVLCGVDLEVSFRSASGAQLASFTPFTSAPPYSIGTLPVTIGCLAPGDIATFYDNGFVSTTVDLTAVRRIETVFSALGSSGAHPALDAPIVSSHVAPVFGELGVEGTLTGTVSPIYNIGIDIFPRDASGLAVGWLIATDLDQLDPGGTFPFTTTGVSTSFSVYRVFTDFIDGPKPPSGSGPLARSAADGDPAIEAAWHRRTARRAAAEERAARTLPSRP
jgi:hypothetical protein